MGYDIGNVIGNLYFSLAHKICVEPDNQTFIAWVKQAIMDTFHCTMDKMSMEYDNTVTFPLYRTAFKEEYLSSVMADSIGYAGTEIVRRTVGDSKVAEISLVEDHAIRIKLDRILICTGIQLIKKRKEIKTGEELVKIFEGVMEAYGN